MKVEFCDSAVCKIEVVRSLEPKQGWVKGFVSLREVLEERYGEATSVKSQLPEECRSDVPRCIAEGRAAFWVSWRWKPGTKITLAMGKASEELVQRITYERSSNKTPAL